MVVAAHQDEVAQVGGAAAGPVPHVVGVAPTGRTAAAGEAAALVAGDDGAAQPGRRGALGAADVDGDASGVSVTIRLTVVSQSSRWTSSRWIGPVYCPSARPGDPPVRVAQSTTTLTCPRLRRPAGMCSSATSQMRTSASARRCDPGLGSMRSGASV